MAGIRGISNNYSFRFPTWDVNIFYPQNSVVAYREADGVSYYVSIQDVPADRPLTPRQDTEYWFTLSDGAFLGRAWTATYQYRPGSIVSHEGSLFVARGAQSGVDSDRPPLAGEEPQDSDGNTWIRVADAGDVSDFRRAITAIVDSDRVRRIQVDSDLRNDVIDLNQRDSDINVRIDQLRVDSDNVIAASNAGDILVYDTIRDVYRPQERLIVTVSSDPDPVASTYQPGQLWYDGAILYANSGTAWFQIAP